jgi:hypothetical protein
MYRYVHSQPIPVVLYHRIQYLYVHKVYVANNIDIYVAYVCTTYMQVRGQSTNQENDWHRDHIDQKILVGPALGQHTESAS